MTDNGEEWNYAPCVKPSVMCLAIWHPKGHEHTVDPAESVSVFEDEAVEAPVTDADNKVEELVTELLQSVQWLTQEVSGLRKTVEVMQEDVRVLGDDVNELTGEFMEAAKPVDGTHKAGVKTKEELIREWLELESKAAESEEYIRRPPYNPWYKSR